ncbi:hypothetical protein PV367_02490 [Streptomyces europaeiscabiei]|uniref:Transposase n=1 Tax=Streptomyces europaeiscabiei TaxID=146819 RepID=A0AAJ2PKI0_9ACTN|nr:hypothetical protein [Streptomyces europaeiscabiei]MDX3128691.1 hypothetical protein [Streptomyces europaeiscabiei]
MTDAEWATILPLPPVPGWTRARGGRPQAYGHQAIRIRHPVDRGIK